MRARVQSLLDPKRLFAGILFLGILTLAARNLTDPDFWWHLRTGQYIVETRSVPHTDPFSFTRQSHPWITHEWLSEVLTYSCYRLFSWGGLIVLYAALTSATFFFLYQRCAGRPYLAGWLVLWAAFACRPTWGVRPQTLSIFLASFLLLLLERPATRRRLWWIVPLTLLWANLHAAYSLGIALLILFLLGTWLDGIFGFTPWRETRAETKNLLFTLFLSLAVVVVNPNGRLLYKYPLSTFHSAAMKNYIAEWFSPDFHRAEYLPLLAAMIAVLAFPAFTTARARPRTILLLCASAYAALQSVRLIPIFVLIAIPFLAAHAEAFLEARNWNRQSREPRTLTPPKLIFHGAIALLLIVLACLQVRHVVGRQPDVEAAAFPAAAVAFLRQNHASGPLFNDYDWGGYLIWKLYPAERVFIDGRADLYGDEFMNQYASAVDLTGDWRATIDRWSIGTALVPTQSALASALPLTKGWKVLFRDQQATILTRIDPPTKGELALSLGVLPASVGDSRSPAPETSIAPQNWPKKLASPRPQSRYDSVIAAFGGD